MSADARLGRLYPGLTAKERAVLALRAFKEDREEDWRVRSSIPASQIDAFNRYMRLIEVVNRNFAALLIVLGEQIAQVELKQSWLMTIVLFGAELESVSDYVLTIPEPITESRLRERTEELRAETMTLTEAAELLAEQHAWPDADLVEEDGERYPSDAAWARAMAEYRASIEGAVTAGELAAHGKGRRLRVLAGDLHDWAGLPFGMLPEWGFEYDVRPDNDAPLVQRLQRDRERVRTRLRRVIPSGEWPILADADIPDAPDHDELGRSLAVALAVGIMRQLRAYWMQTRAVEVAIDELTAELGEDIARVDVRASLDDVKARMQTVAEEMRRFAGDVALPEPDEEVMAPVRRAVQREDG